MSIRYKCDDCGATLTIKDELAGTKGKCPKCKTPFLVPQPAAAGPAASSGANSDTQKVASPADQTVARPPKPAAPAQPKAKAKAKPPAGKRRSAAADDFDPMAVLMGDEPSGGGAARGGASAGRRPPPESDDEIPSDLDLELDLEMGEDDAAEPAPKKPKKRKRVQFDSGDDFDADPQPTAAASATAMLSGGASAGAKDLLTRTMEESRARASRVEEDDDRDRGPTWKDYAREFGPKGFGIVAGLFLGTYLLYQLASSMYGGGMPLPELGRVYGTITLNGQPLEGAKVRFTPKNREQSIDERGKQRFRTSTAVTDEDGYYDLNYTEDVRGAAVTEHRVIIMKIDNNGKLVTPAEYADFSMELRTVESGSQEINFDLRTDGGAPAPAADAGS